MGPTCKLPRSTQRSYHRADVPRKATPNNSDPAYPSLLGDYRCQLQYWLRKSKISGSSVQKQKVYIHPGKTNGWNLKITWFEKANHLSSLHVGFQGNILNSNILEWHYMAIYIQCRWFQPTGNELRNQDTFGDWRSYRSLHVGNHQFQS